MSFNFFSRIKNGNRNTYVGWKILSISQRKLRQNFYPEKKRNTNSPNTCNYRMFASKKKVYNICSKTKKIKLN